MLKQNWFISFNTAAPVRRQASCVLYNINITIGNNPAYVEIVNIYESTKPSFILLLMNAKLEAKLQLCIPNVTIDIQFNQLFFDTGKFK
jgi:hypothetical protein